MIYLQLPASLHFRALALRLVTAACRRLRLPAEIADAIVSAAGEAFNNAVLHVRPTEGPDAVEMEIGVAAGAVEIRVFDYGRGFVLEEVPQPRLPVEGEGDVDLLPEGGMGLFIIRSLMSEVAYEPGPPNVLYMRKDLDRAWRHPGGTGSPAGAVQGTSSG